MASSPLRGRMCAAVHDAMLLAEVFICVSLSNNIPVIKPTFVKVANFFPFSQKIYHLAGRSPAVSTGTIITLTTAPTCLSSCQIDTDIRYRNPQAPHHLQEYVG